MGPDKENYNQEQITTRLNKKEYVKPITEVLGQISSRIIETFEKEGIDGVLNKLDEFSENDYCGFAYYLLSLKEDNQDIYDYICRYFYKLKERGIKKKLSKDVYLKFQSKFEKKSREFAKFNRLFYFDLFKELDDEVVDLIMGNDEMTEDSNNSSEGANAILFNISSFRKIDIEVVLNAFFKKNNNKQERNGIRNDIIKNLLKAGYEENVKNHLEDFGILEEEIDSLENEILSEININLFSDFISSLEDYIFNQRANALDELTEKYRDESFTYFIENFKGYTNPKMVDILKQYLNEYVNVEISDDYLIDLLIENGHGSIVAKYFEVKGSDSREIVKKLIEKDFLIDVINHRRNFNLNKKDIEDILNEMNYKPSETEIYELGLIEEI